MSESQKKSLTTQVYSIYIQATPETIWQSITDPEWNSRYGYQAPQFYELKPGGKYEVRPNDYMKQLGLPDIILDGEVLQVNPPFLLVQTYRFLFNADTEAEGFSKVTWEIEQVHKDFCKLTLTHELDGMPQMAAMVASTFSESGAGGWQWIISDIKSLLETGKIMGEWTG